MTEAFLRVTPTVLSLDPLSTLHGSQGTEHQEPQAHVADDNTEVQKHEAMSVRSGAKRAQHRSLVGCRQEGSRSLGTVRPGDRGGAGQSWPASSPQPICSWTRGLLQPWLPDWAEWR